MRPSPVLLTAAILLAVLPLAAGEDPPDSTAPLSAAAFVSGPNAIVTWVPGADPPDFFTVYGVRDGILSFLTTAAGSNTSAEVPATFPAYAVTATTGSIESEATTAGVIHPPCITVNPDPSSPGVAVGCLGGGVGLLRPSLMLLLY